MLTFYQFQHPGAVDGIEAFISPLAPDGLYRVTPFTLFAKGVTYVLAALALFMSGGFLKTAQMERYEYPLLVTFASLGAGMMLSANDLMTLYVGIETLSLSSYVLAAFRRDSLKSAEAGLKYFVLGALASGLLLYGSSLIYGFTGGTGYSVIAAAPVSVGLTFGLVFVICGLAFKASAAPFHIWTPDVYEGAPAPVVAFFSTAPKIAAVALLAHVMFVTFGNVEHSWQMIIAIISALSMLIGAFGDRPHLDGFVPTLGRDGQGGVENALATLPLGFGAQFGLGEDRHGHDLTRSRVRPGGLLVAWWLR